MNIDYRSGDLLSADAEALVNTVNCVGVMGKGIALQFKKAFPDNFKDYTRACERKEVRPGEMFVTERLDDNPRYIINFPTKRHWRTRSRLSDVESGLTALADQIRRREIHSIAMPALGCGHGGLEWGEVRSLIERMLGGLSADVRIVVFEPEGAPDAKSVNRSVEVPKMTSGRAALVMLMDRYLSGQPGKTRTLPKATVHEFMYFLQAAGEPLKLGYSKRMEGPYAEGLCPGLAQDGRTLDFGPPQRQGRTRQSVHIDTWSGRGCRRFFGGPARYPRTCLQSRRLDGRIRDTFGRGAPGERPLGGPQRTIGIGWRRGSPSARGEILSKTSRAGVPDS